MPRPDPLPTLRQSTRGRFWRIFRLLALLSIVIAGIAVLLVTRGEGEIHASLILATGLGVGFTVLLGTGLMALMFVSSASGHDEAASGTHEETDKE
jgi:hypothetical protein